MPERSKAYESVLALLLGFLLLARIHHPAWLTAAIILTLATLLSPWLARVVAWGWTTLAETIGKVVSRILLGVVFFLVITPIAAVRRMMGRDGLQLSPPRQGSAFTDRHHRFEARDLEKPW